MCKKCGESMDHLILHCETARAIWLDIFPKLELTQVMPVGTLFANQTTLGGPPQIQAMWKMTPYLYFAVFMIREKQLCFQRQIKCLLKELRFFCISTLFLWDMTIDFNGLSTYNQVLSLYTFLYTWLYLSSNKIVLVIKKYYVVLGVIPNAQAIREWANNE